MIFEFPIPTFQGATQPLTYTLLEPSGWNPTVNVLADRVQFIVSDASDLDGEYDLTIEAAVDSTFYIHIEKQFEVYCPFECKFCESDRECTVCKTAYYYECEDISDSDMATMLSWSWVLTVTSIVLGLTGIY